MVKRQSANSHISQVHTPLRTQTNGNSVIQTGLKLWNNPLRTPTNYVGVVSGLTYTYGTQPDIDLANLVLAEARGVEDEINSAGKVTIALKTDLSCVYFSRHSNAASTSVRGVLTVTIPKYADISWIKENYDFYNRSQGG